jgi:hypothetical protein
MKVSSTLIFCLSAFALGACGADGGEQPEPIAEEQQAASPAAVHRSTWNGGNMSGGYGDQFGGGWVNVSLGGSGKNKSAHLNYSRSSVDPSSEVCESYDYCWWPWPADEPICETYTWCQYTRYSYEYGWGQIAASDVSIGPRHGRLSTDVANATNFYAEKCSVDYGTWTWDCSWGPATGTFDLKWKHDGMYSYSSNGTNEQRYGKYFWRTIGAYRSASAALSGSFSGTDVSGYGDVSTSRGTTVSRDMYLAPKPVPEPLPEPMPEEPPEPKPEPLPEPEPKY